MSINTKLLAALSLAGLAVGTAYAAGPVTAGNQYFIAGSTALDNQISDALLLAPANGGPCAAGSITIYTDAPVVAGGNITKAHQRNIVCSLANAIGGIAAGTVVAFSKESNGGSNEGTYYPATPSATLAFMDMTVAPGGCGADQGPIAAGHYWTNQQAIAHEFDGCTGTIVQKNPQIGVADEDPATFTIGAQAVTPAVLGALTTVPLFQNQFNVAVSMPLYRALQTAQGLVVKDDTLANVPTLSREQIASLYGGFITNWSQIGLAAHTVFTCRRGDNSGTNVSADIYFLKNRCETASPTMVGIVSGSGATGTGPCTALATGQTAENNGCTWTNGAAPAGNLSDVTFGGTATADVISCLDAHSRNGDFAYGPVGGTSKFDDPNGATGAAGEAGTAHFRYIAIDGHKPTVVGMGNGTYDYAMDNVENYNNALAGNALSVAQALGTLFQSPVALSDILVPQPNATCLVNGTTCLVATADANYVNGGLQDAFVGTPNAVPVTEAAQKSNPVSAFTYASSGLVNNCQNSLTPNGSTSKEQL